MSGFKTVRSLNRYLDLCPEPTRLCADFDAPPEFFPPELFAPELFAAEPLLAALAPCPAARELGFAVVLAAAWPFTEVFSAPLFADVFWPEVFAAAEVRDFPELGDVALDFADPVFDFEVPDPPDFADEVFVADLADRAPLAPLLAVLRFAPRARVLEPDDAPEFPATVSAAAPMAPTAAPVAAPLKISPATSITASSTFPAVEVLRLELLLELFEVVDRFLVFCFVSFLSGIVFSHWSY